MLNYTIRKLLAENVKYFSFVNDAFSIKSGKETNSYPLVYLSIRVNCLWNEISYIVLLIIEIEIEKNGFNYFLMIVIMEISCRNLWEA